jgi:N-acetylmuramoyl-L-alanine amidase
VKKERQKIKHCLVSAMTVILVLFGLTADGISKKPISRKHQGVVVIDPGHGGNDHGSRSADDVLEKVVALNLARLIADKLKEDLKVTLTRTDDYWLDIPKRTALANYRKADLFISLHTGGSFVHRAGGTVIFYYEKHPEPDLAKETPTLDSLSVDDAPLMSWNDIQDRYLTGSKKLAEIMQAQIIKITQDPDSRIKSAPLSVLQGADMPAILIELGYLTNPNEGKALGDQEFLALIAEAISKGIKRFLFEKGK